MVIIFLFNSYMTTISQQLIFIDSANRTRGTYPNANNFIAKINGQNNLNLPNDTNSYYKISVENAALPYSFYNVNSSDGIQGSGNDYFQLIYKPTISSEVTVIFYFDEGNPTAKDIATQLNNYIPNFTCVYDRDEQKLKFTQSGYDYIKFNFQYFINVNDETAHALLGFNYNTLYTFTTPSFESVKPVNVSFNSSLYLRIANLAGDNIKYNTDNQSYNKGNVIAVFNITNSPGSYIFYQDVGDDNMQLIVKDRTIPELNLMVIDRFNRFIKNLDDYQLCLKFELIQEQPQPIEFFRENVTLRKYLIELIEEIRAMRNDNIQQYNKALEEKPQPIAQLSEQIQQAPEQQVINTMFSEELKLTDENIIGMEMVPGKGEELFNNY